MEKNLEKLIDTCPVRKSLDVIGGKWRLLIIGQFFQSKIHRFSELKKLLPEISEKMLNQELKYLITNKILQKQSFAETPPRVEYSLTQLGENALPFIGMLAEFGNKIEESDE